MTGLPAFLAPIETRSHFPGLFAALEVQSRNLNACRPVPNVALVASVITTEFVTLTVTVFVKEVLKPGLGTLSPSQNKNIFSGVD
jgi:hypothetical protein